MIMSMCRALESYEVREIFSNGQPLSEIATGSTLQELSEDSVENIRQTVLARGQETDEGNRHNKRYIPFTNTLKHTQ